MSENPRKDMVTEPNTPTASSADELVKDLDGKLSEAEQNKVTGGSATSGAGAGKDPISVQSFKKIGSFS